MVPESHHLRTTFGEDVDRYDRALPGCPVSLVEDLCELVEPCPEHRLLEIGAGTGKMTLTMAASGCRIVALEPDPALAACAARQLAPWSSVEVLAAEFGTWPLPDQPFDVVLAGNSYRTLDPAVRVDKVTQALRPGGALAVIETRHVAGGDSRLFAAVRDCFRQVDPAAGRDLQLPEASQVPRRAGTAGSGWFEPPVFRRRQWEITYPASQYIEVVLADSGHRRQPEPVRTRLAECIRRLIEHQFGGRVTMRYLTQLWVVHRRERRSRRGLRANLGSPG
jgi:protein-L-isoaspartate O-methyltransferase